MKVALVLGGAATVWDDVEAALGVGQYQGVVGCNDIGADWPGVMDAWVSLHANMFGRWAVKREAKGYAPHRQVLGNTNALSHEPRVSPQITGYTDANFPGQVHSGSSGLFALKVALVDLGFERAVLCGVPMTMGGAHYFDARDWGGAHAHQVGWIEALHHIKNRARSMSGWTSELLGVPTPEWLTDA